MKKKRLFTRSQITPFIIIGLVIMILLFAAFYVVYLSRTQPIHIQAEQLSAPSIEAAFKLYVQQCIENVAEEPIITLGLQGGTLSPSNYLYYYHNQLNYLCYTEGLDPSWSCVNSMLTKDQMETELSREIEKGLKECINLAEFERFVSDVKAGEMELTTKISDDSIDFTLKYPVEMTFQDNLITVSEFTQSLDYPLGRLYSVSQQIVNDEITDGYFDSDSWMIDNGADVIIEKHQPYPDIVYTLDKNGYKFQFAVQGFPTVGRYVGDKREFYGCCFKDDVCFKNTPPLSCTDPDEDFNPNPECSCSSSYQPKDPCQDGSCIDCTDISRKHGESWCMYDGLVGHGYDLVGTRHYVQKCINGTVYTEDCRDYREEICTEMTDLDKTKAECRPNRWHSCSQCDSKTCCEDSTRDCYWDGLLETSGKCIPQVPPGLRFWQNEGAEVCLIGGEQKKCEGLTCDQSWLDSTARYCYSQGDCGNYMNFAGYLTEQGFYETDIVKKVNENTYDSKGIDKLELGFGRQSSDVLQYSQQSMDPLFLFVSSLYNFMGEISNINPGSYVNPYAKSSEIKITDFTICNLWVAPMAEDCSSCSEDSEKPCTEYKCRSIGEKCDFEMLEGVPVCNKRSSLDFSPPNVEVDLDAIPQQYSLEQEFLGPYSGYRIIEPVRPHKPFTFGVKTDEDTRCTVSLTPRIEDYSLQAVILGDSSFKKNHNLTIRMPPRFFIPDNLYDSISFASANSALDVFYNIKDIVDGIQANLGNELGIYSKITGKNFLSQIKPKVDSISKVLDRMTYNVDQVIRSLLIQFDRGGYYLFFDCIDRAGNRNENQVFIQFIVDYGYTDEEPPIIIHFEPTGKISPSRNTIPIKVYLDEPAECRFDYNDAEYNQMQYSFDCSSDEYALNPLAGGTYECTADAEVPFTDNKIFIRCADNPAQSESYTLNVSESQGMEIFGIDGLHTDIQGISPFNYTNITSSEINVPTDMLENLGFGINLPEVVVNLYMDENKSCRYSETETEYDSMESIFDDCVVSEDPIKGIYRCNTTIHPITQFERSLGGYNLSIELSAENRITSGNPERIFIVPGGLNIVFDHMIEEEDSIKLNFDNPHINLSIYEQAECNATISDTTNQMVCSWDGTKTLCQADFNLEINSDIKFECMNSTPLNVTNRSHIFNIICRNQDIKERNINPESYEFMISKAEELKLVEITPQGVINTKDAELTVRVSKDIIQHGVQCGYNDNPYSYLKMDKIGYRDFRAEIVDLDENIDNPIYIRCTDKYGSVVSQTISLKYIS